MNTHDLRAFCYALSDVAKNPESKYIKYTQKGASLNSLSVAKGDSGFFINIKKTENGADVAKVSHILDIYELFAMRDSIKHFCEYIEKSVFKEQSRADAMKNSPNIRNT